MLQSRKRLRLFFKNLEFHAFRGLGWRLVRGWRVQSQGVHRDFCSSARDSLTGRPFSREKHLENFSTILSLSVLAACPGDLLATHHSLKKRVFGKNWVSF